MLSYLRLSFQKSALNKLTLYYKNNGSKYSGLILILVVIKMGLNLLAIAHFGFQRDELLYIVLGEHLDWGYKEVPPFIALLAKITTAKDN